MAIFLRYLIPILVSLSALIAIPAISIENVAKEKTPTPKTKKLYKVVDEQGNVHYSDQPSKGSEELKIPDVPSIHIRKPDIKIKTLEEELEEKLQANRDPNAKYYAVLDYANLADDGVIRNNGGTATFTVSIDPTLSRGHYIEFYIDGKLIQSRQKELTITAENVTYGTHTTNFTVVNKQGAKVQQSETLTFNLLHVVRKSSKANSINNNPFLKNTPVRAEFFKRNIPEHPKIPSYDTSKQSADKSSNR